MNRATIHTRHGDMDAAAAIAAAVEPDNTEQMTTRVDDDAVVTEIVRETTGGLQSTADDYVVNLTIADRLTDDTTDQS